MDEENQYPILFEGDDGIATQTEIEVADAVGKIVDRCVVSPYLAGISLEAIADEIVKGIQRTVTREMLIEDMEETIAELDEKRKQGAE